MVVELDVRRECRPIALHVRETKVVTADAVVAARSRAGPSGNCSA